jgi:tRNA(fMet)-specific endonuclease VapC
MPDSSKGILLDSSVIIAHFRGKLDLFSLVPPGVSLFMPLAVLGELRKGAIKSGAPERHHKKIDDLLKVVAVALPDDATAEIYARAAAKLEQAGTPIPENDIWIAAAGLELDLPLATRDGHFERVEGLTVLRW